MAQKPAKAALERRRGGRAVAGARQQFVRRGLALAASTAVVLGAIYVVAFGVPHGRETDDTARADLASLTTTREIETFDDLLDLVWLPFVLVAVAAGWLALRGRRAQGTAALALLGGVTVAAFGLRWVLHALDPLGGETHRAGDTMYFPSGHAAAASATGLAQPLLLVTAGTRRLALAFVVAGAYIAAVGVASVAEASHYPSDVLGAYVLALSVAYLVDALIERGPGAQLAPTIAAAATAAAVALACVLLASGDGVGPRGLLGTGMSGGIAAAGLALLGAALPLAYANLRPFVEPASESA